MLINYRGIEIEVIGEYVPADDGGNEYPSTDAYYDIDKCLIEGVNIGELLSGDQWDDIEALCMEKSK